MGVMVLSGMIIVEPDVEEKFDNKRETMANKRRG